LMHQEGGSRLNWKGGVGQPSGQNKSSVESDPSQEIHRVKSRENVATENRCWQGQCYFEGCLSLSPPSRSGVSTRYSFCLRKEEALFQGHSNSRETQGNNINDCADSKAQKVAEAAACEKTNREWANKERRNRK